MSKLKIDLHEVYNTGWLIDKTIIEAVDECVENRIKMLEIVHGKGSGQLKKKVLRILQTPEMRLKYDRIDKDQKNFGRLFVRFKHK